MPNALYEVQLDPVHDSHRAWLFDPRTAQSIRFVLRETQSGSDVIAPEKCSRKPLHPFCVITVV